jgi:hypothetical protein
MWSVVISGCLSTYLTPQRRLLRDVILLAIISTSFHIATTRRYREVRAQCGLHKRCFRIAYLIKLPVDSRYRASLSDERMRP